MRSKLLNEKLSEVSLRKYIYNSNCEEWCQAIEEVQESIRKYNPKIMGYEWDRSNPRIQLEPIGKRGYIEMVAVKTTWIKVVFNLLIANADIGRI